MGKKKRELPIGALIRLHSDGTVGIIKGVFSGSGRWAVYTIKWLGDNDHPNFMQAHCFEVIG